MNLAVIPGITLLSQLQAGSHSGTVRRTLI